MMNIERVKYEKFIYCQQNLKPTQFEICSKTGCVFFFSWCAVIFHCAKNTNFLLTENRVHSLCRRQMQRLALCGGGYVIIVFTCIQIISINIVQIN